MQHAPKFETTKKDTAPSVPHALLQEKSKVLSFAEERERIKLNLFRMRKAHEITQRLGFRDRNIDQGSIDTISNEMKSKGIHENEYKEYLKEDTHYII